MDSRDAEFFFSKQVKFKDLKNNASPNNEICSNISWFMPVRMKLSQSKQADLLFWSIFSITDRIDRQMERNCKSPPVLSIQEWVSFFWVHGEWIVARDKQIGGTAKRFSADLLTLFRATIHSPWTQKKYTHSLYLQCFQPRALSKIIRGKL